MENIKESSERMKYIAMLREVARWLELHPEVPIPFSIRESEVRIYRCDDKKNLAAIVRAVGTMKKSESIDYLKLTGDSGFGFRVLAVANRNEVCERRVVGHRTVTKQVPVDFRTETVEEDIVEWDCGSILAPQEQTDTKGDTNG